MEIETTTVILTLTAIVAVRWIIWRWQQTSIFSKLNIPGPRPNLWFGNYLQLYAKDPIVCQKEWTEKYGRVLGYYQGMTPVLLVTDPQMLKDIFVKDFPKFINRAVFNPLETFDPKKEEDNAIIHMEGQKWKELRSILTPSYTTAKMKQMSGSMISSIEEMVDILKTTTRRGEDLDIHDTYKKLTMDIITRTAFGVMTDVQKSKEHVLMTSSEKYLNIPFGDPLTIIGLSFPWLRPLCLALQKVKLGWHDFGVWPFLRLREGLLEVLESRRRQPQSGKMDLLQLMIDAKVSVDEEVDIRKLEAGSPKMERDINNAFKETRNFTDKEIVANSVNVLLAGYATTSKTLTFTSYLLAKHQDIQEKVFLEINKLILSGQSLEYATVNKLPYLDRVLSESMRLYPPAILFTNRIAMEDVFYGDLKIPKGMMVQAPAYLLQHDSEFWANPEVFDPDRFLTNPNEAGITYLPFGAGPRNCMGMRFAQMEMKFALCYILLNLRLRLPNEMQDEMEIKCYHRTITPAKEVKMKMELRNK